MFKKSSEIEQAMESPETDDATLHRSVFPDEVWREILNNLSQFSKIQLFYSHSYSRCLLLPTSHQLLFLQLWNILAEFEYRTKTAETAKVTSPNSILRQVCKHWCSYIDSDCDGYGGRLNLEKFPDDSNKAKMFLDHFRDTHAGTDRNPFIGKIMRLSLYSSMNQGDPPQGYTQAIMEIFRTYGQHLWHLEIFESRPDPPTWSSYSRLKSWLLLTPNLKSLMWHEHGSSNLPPDAAAELERLVETSPMPRLEHIKKLELNGPTTIAEHFIRINSHVEDIHCSASISWDQFSLSNLTKLYISSKKVEDIGQLEKARAYGWMLKYIHLCFDDIPHFVSLERFWSILQIWNETLVFGSLSLPAARTFSELQATFKSIKFADLNLHKVITFQVVIANAVGVDYIFPDEHSVRSIEWKKVEEGFKVLHAGIGESVSFQVTRFWWKAEYPDEGMKSHSWEKFPSIGQVTGVRIPILDAI